MTKNLKVSTQRTFWEKFKIISPQVATVFIITKFGIKRSLSREINNQHVL